MMFSVILPLYNKENYVERTLHSLLSQKCRDFEVLVVDDGSMDDSLRVVEGWRKEHEEKIDFPFCVVAQCNEGVSAARNRGASMAHGEFLCFLDCDDWWSPDFLRDMEALTVRLPLAHLYGANYYMVKNGRMKEAPVGVANDFTEGYIDYVKVYSHNLCMPLWTGATVVRRDAFEEMGGFDVELKLGEDFDLWLRMSLKFDVAFLNRRLSFYNQDVEKKNRALGHLYPPSQHELSRYENYLRDYPDREDLKELIDKKRLYTLYWYYLSSRYRNFARGELAKVDWSQQSAENYRRYCVTPILWLQIKESGMVFLASCKRLLLYGLK